MRRLRTLLCILIGLNVLIVIGGAAALFTAWSGIGRSINALPNVLQRARPAVVTLRVTGERAVPHELVARSAGMTGTPTPLPSKVAVRSGGSGVIIDARNGYILTNNHVVEDATSIDVGIADGRHLSGTLIGRDPGTDLALIKVAPENLPSIRIGNSDKVRVGDLVVAVGSPFGLEGTATAGIISAVMRTEIGHEAFEDYFQIDAQINRGNSGGALVNARGELIGINTVIAGGGGQAYTIGFAIPINMAMIIQNELVKNGRMRRGFAGVVVKDYARDKDNKVPNIYYGAVVEHVVAESSAAAQGIVAGDIIIAAADKPVRSAAEYQTRASLVPIGSRLPVVIYSGDRKRRVSLEVVAKGIEPKKQILQSHLGSIEGLVVIDIIPGNPRYGNVRGVQIAEVPASSAGHAAGLVTGDVIVAVDGGKVTSVAEMVRRIEQAGLEYKLDILRDANPVWVRLKR